MVSDPHHFGVDERDRGAAFYRAAEALLLLIGDPDARGRVLQAAQRAADSARTP